MFAHLVEEVEKVRREQGPERLPEGLRSRPAEENFHLLIPALDAIFEINGEDADVDGLQDVLIEFLEPLELGNLSLQPTVELRILDRDADVAGE